MALRAGKKTPLMAELDGGQRIEQPDLFRLAHQQEAQDYHRSGDVRQDQQPLAVVAVGGYPGERADQERRQHAHYEEPAHRQPGSGQLRDQRGGGDQVEPVAEQADDLAEPQVAVVGVAAYQGQVADGFWRVVLSCGHMDLQVRKPGQADRRMDAVRLPGIIIAGVLIPGSRSVMIKIVQNWAQTAGRAKEDRLLLGSFPQPGRRPLRT